MYSTGNQSVDFIGNLKFTGNIIPEPWYHNIRTEAGKVDTVAILILADIVYWYRPTYIRDEETGLTIGVKKKFKSDLLQRSYPGFMEKFGFTEKQTREALKRLENLGVAERVFRTVDVPNVGRMNNVMFIKIDPAKIAEISRITDGSPLVTNGEPPTSPPPVEEPPGSLKGNRGLQEGGDLVPKKETGGAKKGTTNTKSTTKISSKSTSKTLYGEFVALTDDEHDKLLEKYGRQQTDTMIEMLDNYKGANGKNYASDYRAILSWVVKRYNEENKGNGKPGTQKLPRAFQSMLDMVDDLE